MAVRVDPFDGIIGLPPRSYVSDTMIKNSMPVLEIQPGKPNFSRGLSLFTIEDATSDYDDILRKVGFFVQHPIRIAFLADNFPSDTFTNDYGETFLQKSTDVGAENLGQLMQMTGTQSVLGTGGALDKLSGILQESGDAAGGFIGKGLTGAGNLGANARTAAERMIANAQAGQGLTRLLGGGAQTLNYLLANHRIDFPQIWRNSGYNPQYSITVRLYNPYPQDIDATDKYIIGPLAVILALGIPRTTDGNTYTWPFFHRIKSKGIWFLDPGVITSINVIKGGDQQQIAFNQRLSIVDVRIDFTSLYNSIVAEKGDTDVQRRPTLKNYLFQLREEGEHYDRGAMREDAGRSAGAPNQETTSASEQTEERTPEFTNDNAAARQAQTVTQQDVTPRGGSQQDFDKANRLANENALIGLASTG